MAIGFLARQGLRLLGLTQVVTGSCQIGPWKTIHDDAEAAASSAAELIRPLSVTSANVHALAVPPGATRVMVRVRWAVAGAVTTSPVVRVYGVYGERNASDWFPDDGTVQLIRLDRDLTGAGGVTVTLDATNDLRDTTYSYSNPAIHTDTGLPYMDCKGAGHVFVLVSTAANVAGAASIQAAFLN
jgi:hypothetical protein